MMLLLFYICFIFLLNNFTIHAYVETLLGTFLENFVPTLVLYNSGASRTFVSTSLGRCFSTTRRTLDRTLKVAIAADHSVSASEVYRDYVLEIFGVKFSIDLIPITMGDVYVIFGID